MSPTVTIPRRGEVWFVDLEPIRGAEIGKLRTVVVMSADGLARLPLHIVIPITGWRPTFAGYVWFAKLSATQTNGLSKISGADAFQIRSLSRERFVKKIGRLTADQVQELTYRVALCIGMDPDRAQVP